MQSKILRVQKIQKSHLALMSKHTESNNASEQVASQAMLTEQRPHWLCRTGCDQWWWNRAQDWTPQTWFNVLCHRSSPPGGADNTHTQILCAVITGRRKRSLGKYHTCLLVAQCCIAQPDVAAQCIFRQNAAKYPYQCHIRQGAITIRRTTLAFLSFRIRMKKSLLWANLM